MKNLLLLAFLASFLSSSARAQSIEFKTGDFALAISGSGQITAMRDPVTGKDFLAKGQKAPLMRIRVASEWLEPAKASFSQRRQRGGTDLSQFQSRGPGPSDAEKNARGFSPREDDARG